MKTQFIRALIKKMVGDRNFLLLKDRNGNLAIGEDHAILVKDHLGSSIVVELIDGELLSAEEITAQLQNNSKLITTNKPKHGFFFFEVFIFEGAPDQAKLTAINTGQFQNLFGKTFLKCLTVNLGEKTVARLFKVPKSDLGLSKTITRLFAADFTEPIDPNNIKELVSQKEAEYRISLKSQLPVVTYVLIALNALVGLGLFLYAKKSGVSYGELLIDFGAKENYRILSGEYWRFLTPVFLHANIVHLFINCYSLYAIGVLVENIFGRFKFATVYFSAGIIGNIASFIFSTNPGVGASGAIFGLLGALLYFGLNKPALFKSHFGYNVILTIVINLTYGFSTTGIDNFAHIGGLVGGFLASGMVLPSEKKRWYTNRVFYLVLTTVMAVSGLFYGFNNTQSKIIIELNELTKLDQAKNWTQVQLKAEEILELNPKDKNVKSYLLWTLVKAQSLSGNYVEAISNAKKLAAIDPQNGHYLLGLLYYDIRQYSLARQELILAKESGAKQKIIDQLIKEIEKLEK